jgi:uncharacterized membrane protein
MNDDEFKIVALMIIGFMIVIAAYPILVEKRGEVEPFSELGILGPGGKLGDYPREVNVGQSINLYIYVGNHEGNAEYFKVVAKTGNTKSNLTDTTPLNAPILASWDFILANDENSTIPIKLSLPVAGLNQRLVFELERYDTTSQSFVYHQRWTQLWMNVTASG